MPVLQISSKKHPESMSLLKLISISLLKYGDESAFISARLQQAWPILSGWTTSTETCELPISWLEKVWSVRLQTLGWLDSSRTMSTQLDKVIHNLWPKLDLNLLGICLQSARVSCFIWCYQLLFIYSLASARFHSSSFCSNVHFTALQFSYFITLLGCYISALSIWSVIFINHD